MKKSVSRSNSVAALRREILAEGMPAAKLKKLVERYPEIGRVTFMLNQHHYPRMAMNIYVKRTDANLLYYKGESLKGWGTYLWRDSGLVGSLEESLYIVGRKGIILKGYSWVDGKPRLRVRDVVARVNPTLKPHAIVLVRTNKWFVEDRDDTAQGNRPPFGEHVATVRTVTRYGAPKRGTILALLDEVDVMRDVTVNLSLIHI